MKEKRTIMDYLNDIKEYSEAVIQFTNNITYEDFVKDMKTKFATVRALEVVGEATKNIPEKSRKKYPNISWKAIAGTIDKIAHEYFGIDYQIVWEVSKNKIPELIEEINKIIEIEIKEEGEK